MIDAKCLAPSGGDHIKAHLIAPGGQTVPIEITDNGDGTYKADYTPVELGEWIINCSFGDKFNLIDEVVATLYLINYYYY